MQLSIIDRTVQNLPRLFNNERERLGYENAREVFTSSPYLGVPNEYGYEFIARKLDTV
jgi:hypothetical protein